MNLIDTADVYGLDWGGTAFGSAEELLGEVLQDAPGLREQMVLASKGGIIPGVPYDSAYLEQACDDSLRRLGVDCLTCIRFIARICSLIPKRPLGCCNA